MIGKPGPFQVVENEGCGAVPAPMDPPRRRYECVNYETCLNIACALNWDSFTCRGCSGDVDESVCWRARQALRKDQVADRLCELPTVKMHEAEEAGTDLKKVVNK